MDLLTLDDLRKIRRRQNKITTGVYFLFDEEGNLLYVGQSRHVEARLEVHSARKPFHSFSVVECTAEQLNDLEAAYILLFKPPRNYGASNYGGDALRYPGTDGLRLLRDA